ncbi:MAG: DNA/RNA nuclease SfsA [Oscillospiraceae bacterium]|nr:DNA/RNA nuclease SfsA [Oscillospiraceae bacterium]
MHLYHNIHQGIFIDRPNRFIAFVKLGGQVEKCHVKNTGRCKELLVPGVTVYVNKSDKPDRVTAFDLVAVYKGEELVNIDSSAPNKIFLEYLQSGKYLAGITHIKPEAKHGSSRFDFYVEVGERKIFIEVKGVTLEEDGVAMFPDAPTQRGVKHLRELALLAKQGYEAHVVFVITMSGVTHFTPNHRTHPEFAHALAEATKAGVRVQAYSCNVRPDRVSVVESVQVK